jgi:peptidoglycan hydrolase-like protein with peptidoglycan-binding domain
MNTASTPFNRGTGALPDSAVDKKKLYKYEEARGVAKAAIWIEKQPDQWKRYGKIRDQYTSGSCVWQAIALILGIENLREEGKFYEFSARSGYARNFVAPGGGCYPIPSFQWAAENGLPFEIQLRSQLVDEMSMRVISDETEGDRIVAKIFRGGKFLSIDPWNTDAIASIVDIGKGIGISVRFNGYLNPDGGAPLSKSGKDGHEIVIVDRTLWKGKRSWVCQNSWSDQWGFKGLFVITEDEFIKGCDSVLYFEDFKNKINDSITEKPKYVFTKNLKLGSDNTEVAMLQRCLGYLKDSQDYLFPMIQPPTGYFGGLTRDGVKRFQAMQGIKVTGEVDSATRIELNNIFK